MSTECSDLGDEFWLPEEFLDDDFFSEEEKAAVAARSESDEEDSLAGLSRRLAGLLGDDGDRKPPTAKVASLLSACTGSLCSAALRCAALRLRVASRGGISDPAFLLCGSRRRWR
jgi:hypothetical protein